MSQVSPSQIFQEVANAIPDSCRENIVIIGSLAAGYHFFGDDTTKVVRTKDVDCVIEPFTAAVAAGQTIARQLFDAGWQRRLKGDHVTPGNESTPIKDLPAIRLYPPEADPNSEEAWFIEFLTVPQDYNSDEKEWYRLALEEGHFGLPSFRYLSLTAYDPLPAGDLGIRYARPVMMALANLLSHPTIVPDEMSSPFHGKKIKRSNKDLGRVLAITTLADLDDYRPWAKTWKAALETAFPDDWKTHALEAGNGLRELLNSPPDLDEALHTCTYGLLNSAPASLDALKAAGQRLEADAIEALENYAR